MTPVQETFTEALEFTSELTPRSFPNLIKPLESTWIEEALLSTGTATIRRRRVPAEQTVWLLLGMALMRDLPITAVARQLDIALPARDGTRTVASSALTQARARLGAEPMEWLFLRSAEEWAHRSASSDRWRGLALYGADGTKRWGIELGFGEIKTDMLERLETIRSKSPVAVAQEMWELRVPEILT